MTPYKKNDFTESNEDNYYTKIVDLVDIYNFCHTSKFPILGCEYKTLNKINSLNISIKLVKVNLSFCQFRYRKSVVFQIFKINLTILFVMRCLLIVWLCVMVWKSFKARLVSPFIFLPLIYLFLQPNSCFLDLNLFIWSFSRSFSSAPTHSFRFIIHQLISTNFLAVKVDTCSMN